MRGVCSRAFLCICSFNSSGLSVLELVELLVELSVCLFLEGLIEFIFLSSFVLVQVGLRPCYWLCEFFVFQCSVGNCNCMSFCFWCRLSVEL